MRVYDRHYYRSGALFEYGVDLASRTVFLWGDIDEEAIAKAGKAILMLDSMGNKTENDPITVYISTYGGAEYEMWGLYDIMRNCQNTIKTVGVGKIMSAGPLLLSAGDEGHRFVHKNARIMLHQSSDSIEGKVKELEHELKELKDSDRRWVNEMASRTSKDAKHWSKITTNNLLDHYIGADEAIAWGIVDHIIDPDEEE